MLATDIEPYLQHFFDKVSPILCPGCGNAPLHPQVRVLHGAVCSLSSQMYEAGYSKQICVDTSVVVIGMLFVTFHVILD